MILIESVVPPAPQARHGKARDTLSLTWEGRRWTRRRTTTTGGREVALALPTGTLLPIGGLLWIDTDWYLEVEGALEPVIAVRPHDHREALRIAFEVGNRHFTVASEGDELLVPDDTAMVQLLERLGTHWERREAVYSPMGFGHSHDHPQPHIHSHSGPVSAHAHER